MGRDLAAMDGRKLTRMGKCVQCLNQVRVQSSDGGDKGWCGRCGQIVPVRVSEPPPFISGGDL